MDSTICTEESKLYVQDASETQEEEEGVDQETSMNETSSSLQRQDDNIQGEYKRLSEACDPKNQSLTLRKRVFENTVQEKSVTNIDSVIEAFLTKKMMKMEHKLSKDIQTEVQSALNNEFKKYREEQKSDQIVYTRRMEQFVAKDDCNFDTVPGVTSSISDRITYWRNLANEEWTSARKTDLRTSTGIHTVICIDTTGKESEAWSQAKMFCTEFLNGLKGIEQADKSAGKVAIVVFGTETKVCRRFTSDFDSLISDIDKLKQDGTKLKPDGPSPMFGGLVLSIAEAEISDRRYPQSLIEIWPKIILITDGRLEENSEGIAQQTKSLVLNEAKSLIDRKIELNIVYVGKADFVFLHQLREYADGSMMPPSDGVRNALDYKIKDIIQAFNAWRTRPKPKDSEDKQNYESNSLDKHLVKLLSNQLKSLKKIAQDVSQMIPKTHDKYIISDDKRYPPIGSRVRRSKDWTYGEQDGNGVGTIIGHYPKEPNERQYRVCVEWDENEDAHDYRFKALSGTKSDVKIVDDERIPPDDCPIAVGMKVTAGKDFKGKKQPKQGVVIKMIVQDDSDKGSKAEVLWEDGTRAEYFFGDEGTEVEIEPRTIYDKPDIPRRLTVRSASDTEVCLKWERPVSCGGCCIKKYTVFRRCDNADNEDCEWLQTTEVDGSQTSATISDLLPKQKYKFSVRAENKIGFGKSIETESTVTLDLNPNRPQAPVGPVRFMDITKSSCTLSWQKSPDSLIEPVTHYLIDCREKNGKWTSISAGLDPIFKISDLRKSTKYEVRIKAVNENGESDPLGIDTFQTLKLLDDDIPDAELQDTDIVELAEGIGHNWEMLGPYFNTENVEINRIKEDFPRSVTMQIHSMLSKWKREKESEATFHKFLCVVEKFKTVIIDWDIIEKVARRLQGESSR